MTSQLTYDNLALKWSPRGKRDNFFIAIALFSLVLMMLVGFILSTVELPIEERKAKRAVPERIAEMVLEREKEKPKPPPPPVVEPKPKPKPIEKDEERITKERDKEEIEKVLTKEEKDAREIAKDEGLLALVDDLGDIIDVGDSIGDMVSADLVQSDGSARIASTLDKGLLTDGAGEGSGGISNDRFGSIGVSTTKLSKQEMSLVKQSLLSKEVENKISGSGKGSDQKGATGNERSEEEVTLVFDKNKGRLYSIYNRERKHNPTLKGKIVLEITIAPDGKVIEVSIISSELDNPKLERGLVSRVKLFKFSPGKTKPLTVRFPVEFLPS